MDRPPPGGKGKDLRLRDQRKDRGAQVSKFVNGSDIDEKRTKISDDNSGRRRNVALEFRKSLGKTSRERKSDNQLCKEEKKLGRSPRDGEGGKRGHAGEKISQGAGGGVMESLP